MSSSIPPFEVMDDGPYIVLVVLGTISSVLSLLGSSCVIFLSFRERHKVMHRLMLALSVSDWFSSIASLFMPYAIPSFLGLPGAIGNYDTCTVFGFFLMTFILVGCLYNAYLSLYFYLVVVRNWRERDFTLAPEAVAHAVGVLVPLAVNVVAAVTESINPSPLINNVCIYATFPWGCSESDDMICTRSDRETVVDIVFFGSIWLFVFSMVGFVSTFCVWYTVRLTVQRSSAYRFQSSSIRQSQNQNRQSQNNNNNNNATDDRLVQVRTQAILYSLAYLNTAFWPLMGALFSSHFFQTSEQIQERKLLPVFYALQLFYWALYPLQGFLNFFIYTRLMVRRWRRVEPDQSIFWIYKQILTTRQSDGMSSTVRHNTNTKSRSNNNSNISRPLAPAKNSCPLPEVTTDADNEQSAFAIE
ncbi:expressed unknown protein [Seminavis robusta]|uniref:G-protein coupled receptors family 1 profile domain-containing protein n=1 Tax=Seminavis robusta TaxID=568900 RepID=A0A9N8D975_9STRA|nr:expressed unknown protein [Seminavis robusta]|eukprot:Sro6_g005300.1 n/a (415) ;mRNA; r:149758-151143